MVVELLVPQHHFDLDALFIVFTQQFLYLITCQEQERDVAVSHIQQNIINTQII